MDMVVGGSEDEGGAQPSAIKKAKVLSILKVIKEVQLRKLRYLKSQSNKRLLPQRYHNLVYTAIRGTQPPINDQ